MAGTLVGGKKAALTNRLKYGDSFYTNIGKLGGSKSRGGGFAKDRELARRAGRIGGLNSSRSGVSSINHKRYNAG